MKEALIGRLVPLDKLVPLTRHCACVRDGENGEIVLKSTMKREGILGSFSKVKSECCELIPKPIYEM